MRNKGFAMPVIICTLTVVTAFAATAFINIKCAVICLALGAVITGVFCCYTSERYKKLSELNAYLSRVVNGDYDLQAFDNTEGELSILKNNLLKVIVSLKTSEEALKNDKIYLANSLADISHQLKTPLTSMMVITDLLKQERNDEKQEEFIDIIESECEKMKWLISNLLKLSKLDAGTAEFNIATLDVEDIIDTSVSTFELLLELRNITFIKSIKPFTIEGDKNWLREAIENIVKNCIEHTDNGGELIISTETTTLYNQITIKDNGCGIAKEDLPHIFERFYHGKNSSADSVGIGLALAKEILKVHRANIKVYSVEGSGTKFEIRFYKSIV